MIFVLVPRGIDGKGGIERQMRYLLAELAGRENAPAFRVLVPRGATPYPWAVLAFAKTLSQFTAAACLGRVQLLHVNLSADGSTLRKFWFLLASRVFAVP